MSKSLRVYKRNQINKTVDNCTLKEVLTFLSKTEEIECDTETWGFDCHSVDILCIQFGNKDNQYLIEWSDSLIELLSPFFRSPEKTFLFQNAKFDLQFLYKKGIWVYNIYDTLLVETIITNGSQFGGRSLDKLVAKYANEYMSKEVRDMIVRVGLTEAVVDYGLDDVKYLSIIKEKQMETVKKYNLETAVKLDNNFVKVLAYVEFCGIGFDQVKWLAKCDQDEIEWAQKEQELNDLVIADERLIKYRAYGSLFDPPGTIVCKMNWKAPKQVQEMFKILGVDVTIEDGGDVKDSVGVQVLQKNLDKPIVKAYAEYIKLNKRITSFGRSYLGFINSNTNRIHTVYQQILNTGRMSSGSARQNKPNLQQVPNNKEHRGCFIAEPGNKLICADYTGQEAVIFANKCLDPNLLAFYDGNLGDMHSYVAKLCFPSVLGNLDLKEIKKLHPDLRQKAKAAGFAIQFGGVGYTISNNLGISAEEGDEVYKAYTEAFPEMFTYFKKVSSTSKELGYVNFNDLTKRKFFFDFMPEYEKLGLEINKEFWDKYRIEKAAESAIFENVLKPKVTRYFKLKGVLERTSYNYPVQGTAADCTKYGSYLFFQWLIEQDLLFKVKIVNVVHDELIVECAEDMAEMIKEKVKYFLELAGKYFCKRVPLFAEPQIAEEWVH